MPRLLQADHTSSGVRRPPLRWLLAGLALAAVLVVVVVLLAGGSSDEPKLTVTAGAASAGFPLRGNLARDTAAVRAAADAWLADDAREGVHSQVLDHEDDVEMRALWAGRLGDTTVVILAEDRNAAFVERESDGAFHVSGVEEIRDADDPGLVAFTSFVLVDTKADPVFMPAVARPPDRVAALDGLWATGNPKALPSKRAGVLVLRTGMRRWSKADRTAPVAVVVSSRARPWLIDAALQAKFVPATEGGFSPPAYQRLIAATTLDDDDRNIQRSPLFDPPKLRLVQDRSLPVLGPTMVLTAESESGRDRVLAANGGSSVAGKEDEAEPLALGDGTGGDNAAYGHDGQAFAAVIVDRGMPEQPSRGLWVFVAGSSQIETIEVLTGRTRLTRPGPVAVVALPEASDLRAGERSRPRGDVAVLGRTRAGTVVVPSVVGEG